MQYKIPIQIENEDTIVAWLSLRQLAIMMLWWWVAYGVFQKLSVSAWETVALIVALPIVALGIIIALVKVSEMTFLPTILSMIRLSLNAKSRSWSVGTDSYSDLEVWYVILPTQVKENKENQSLESRMNADEQVSEKILKL
jgi:PrgI family protein